jgi:hypothetical protein
VPVCFESNFTTPVSQASLSNLVYSMILLTLPVLLAFFFFFFPLVGLGFELRVSQLQSRCSAA